MIDSPVLERVLSEALRHGGEFAEVFAEDRSTSSAVLDDGRVEELSSGRERGAGIRVVAGETTGFAHTADLSEAGLLRAAEAASAVARGGAAARRGGRRVPRPGGAPMARRQHPPRWGRRGTPSSSCPGPTRRPGPPVTPSPRSRPAAGLAPPGARGQLGGAARP